MKVLKFGGTSVGTAASLRNVKQIVEACEGKAIVVVSALGGITDQLIATARQASKGDAGYLTNYAAIVERHLKIIDEIVPEQKRVDVRTLINPLLEELGNIFRGINLIKDLSPRTQDVVVSYGERLSSVIISNVINGARHFDSRNFIITQKQFGKHILDNERTSVAIHKTFDEADFKTAVVPGFIASDREGDITNLGRGGSDYTAAILAATLDAEVLEIWTDVDGFMTADPRVISTAYVIEHLSFPEAMELCNFGAKVIYPPTIYPVFHKDIPIRVKNTFNPTAEGTLISSQHTSDEEKAIKGISSINDTCLITVSGLGMVGIIGINARIFDALAKNGVSVFLVSQASSENNISIAVKNDDAQLAVDVIAREFEVELQSGELTGINIAPNLATVAIVGENMKHTSGIAGKLFNTLGRNGINVIACAQGATETNISFVIEHSNLRKALNVIHDSFFLSQTQVLNLFIVGIGNVGRRLLSQIQHQQDKLLKEKALSLKVVGVANSRKCVFDSEGIDINDFERRLEESSIKAEAKTIKDAVVKMNIYNPVFVDCTASADIAEYYSDLLSKNVNVVAANKIAASSDYDNYSRLKELARRKDVKYLFETNVGAGLPVINTINNMINSGDRILKIEAVLSGTLNYIFNVLSADIPFSKAVSMAREAGYAEPDPRIDLSGKDVIRKLVILAREAGYRVEQEDVKQQLFIPEKFFKGDVEEFFAHLGELDDYFEQKRIEAVANNMQYRFIARLSGGEASVSLEAVPSDHPFYSLEGSNNIISLTTERYREYPIIIKGYGAGADVTAAGVFADIISIANIR
jgi:aspartokinase/homoserine dehydrogenase 1